MLQDETTDRDLCFLNLNIVWRGYGYVRPVGSHIAAFVEETLTWGTICLAKQLQEQEVECGVPLFYGYTVWKQWSV